MLTEQKFYLATPPLTEQELTQHLFAAERIHIDNRRKEMKKRAAAAGRKFGDRTQAPLTGLALSGGGIRSASVCLGALQALHQRDGIEGVDYLCTVSGGGYIGCSLTAGLDRGSGAFPFAHDKDYCDTDAVRHIRDFSKYLIPNGFPDIVISAVIFMRGLLANAILIAPLMFGVVWFTLKCHPDVVSLDTPKILWMDAWTFLPTWAPGGTDPLWKSHGFYVTQNLLLFTLLSVLIWAFYRSFVTSSLWRGFKDMAVWSAVFEPIGYRLRQLLRKLVLRLSFGRWNIEGSKADIQNPGDNSDELRGLFPFFLQLLFGVTLVSALFELQPFILQRIPDIAASLSGTKTAAVGTGWSSQAVTLIYNWLSDKTPQLAPFGAALAFLSKFLLNFETLAERSSKGWVRLLKIIPLAGWWFVGLIIPSFLWYVYLELCKLGLVGGANSSLLDYAPNGAAHWLELSPDTAGVSVLSFLPQWISEPMTPLFAWLLDFVSAFSIGEALFSRFHPVFRFGFAHQPQRHFVFQALPRPSQQGLCVRSKSGEPRRTQRPARRQPEAA